MAGNQSPVKFQGVGRLKSSVEGVECKENTGKGLAAQVWGEVPDESCCIHQLAHCNELHAANTEHKGSTASSSEGLSPLGIPLSPVPERIFVLILWSLRCYTLTSTDTGPVRHLICMALTKKKNPETGK